MVVCLVRAVCQALWGTSQTGAHFIHATSLSKMDSILLLVVLGKIKPEKCSNVPEINQHYELWKSVIFAISLSCLSRNTYQLNGGARDGHRLMKF